MASSAGPATLAHRSVTSIRGGSDQSAKGPPGPSTPTSTRPNITTTYGSPSSLRADDDIIVLELGSRYVRAGFAGDSVPKANLQCGPEQQRRVGDLRTWQGTRVRNATEWAKEHEIWGWDMRQTDLGLVQDKLERVLRDAFTRYLLIDSRPRRLGLILDSAVPVPLLSAVLDTIFTKFQTPTISIMSSAVATAIAAGVRSALVINMGWTESTVTSVYEYREVRSTRTVRSGKLLLETLYKALHLMIKGKDRDKDGERVISFEECEDIMCRLMWCRASRLRSSQRQSTQLETVEEQDESEAETPHAIGSVSPGVAKVPINSSTPPTRLELPFDKLADVCDETFFGTPEPPPDDEELPLHILVYRHLLHLPLDVRAICMPRIIFAGGCSSILGIKERIMDEVMTIVEKRGWEPVVGKGVDQLRNNPKLKRKSRSLPTDAASTTVSESEEDGEATIQSAANADLVHDPIEAKIIRNRDVPQQMQGQIRVLHSLGPWTGGSLVCQLKVHATATIERDVWFQQGAQGAIRPNEVDYKAQHRQSMGAGGLIRGSGGHHSNWTLGTWGYL